MWKKKRKQKAETLCQLRISVLGQSESLDYFMRSHQLLLYFLRVCDVERNCNEIIYLYVSLCDYGSCVACAYERCARQGRRCHAYSGISFVCTSLTFVSRASALFPRTYRTDVFRDLDLGFCIKRTKFSHCLCIFRDAILSNHSTTRYFENSTLRRRRKHLDGENLGDC